ncbi:hypothetical protein PybrP1_012701 [[Pythium] brassicae (nom. inval.)]|nr:hypothetical protein PybrP1_012701 [[Pythium] brassicae (nom. inval.)]
MATGEQKPSWDERLRGVFTLKEAEPVLDEYLSSIVIDEDDPGFLIDWDMDHVAAFVAAANAMAPGNTPDWLRTRPPHVTLNTFADDVVHKLSTVAGGRCANVLLAPNSVAQCVRIASILRDIQHDDFMQAVAQEVLPQINNTAPYLARTYNITTGRTVNAVPNLIPPAQRDGRWLRLLFN